MTKLVAFKTVSFLIREASSSGRN